MLDSPSLLSYPTILIQKTMNVTFLLITLLLAVTAAVLFYCSRKAERESGTEVLCAIAGAFLSLATLICFLNSFLLDFGAPITTRRTDFELEKTPYRVIVKVAGKEYVYKDAEIVLNADKISAVNLTQKRNAWGVEVDSPSCWPVFEKVDKGAQK